MSYKLWGWIDEARHGSISKTRIDSVELSWPWMLIPESVNTHSILTWRFDTNAMEWKRRYRVMLSVSLERIRIDSDEFSDVMIVVPDEDDFQIVRQWKDLRVWVDDVLYELEPGEIVEVSAHQPKRIVVRLDDARVYCDCTEKSILALEEVPELELDEEEQDGESS